MHRILLLTTVLAAACDDYVLPPPSDDELTQRIGDVLALDGNFSAGEAAFTTECAPCHDATGQTAKIGPALQPWLETHGDAELLTVIFVGQGAMSAIPVEDQEAADIVAWMDETFRKP